MAKAQYLPLFFLTASAACVKVIKVQVVPDE